MVAYWWAVFTRETWQEAGAAGFMVVGFNEPRLPMVQKIATGDILVCYIAGEKKIAGALQVTGAAYLSEEPRIWKRSSFPARLSVVQLIILDNQHEIDCDLVLPQLSFYDSANNARTWAHLQGSPKRLSDADGVLLLVALEQAQRGGLQRPVVEGAAVSPDVASAMGPDVLSATAPVAVADPLELLINELITAQRDAGRPATFESAVARAFEALGFTVHMYGQAGKTDVVVESLFSHDRFRAVVDAKASSNGKVPDTQVHPQVIDGHRQQEAADFAVVVGEKFAGGNLRRFAAQFEITLLDTETLVEVLRLHAQTVFSVSDLRALFRNDDSHASVLAELRQKAEATQRRWSLIADVVRLLDDFRSLPQPLSPTAQTLHALLIANALRARGATTTLPTLEDVQDALVFLSSKAVGVLRPTTNDPPEYVLIMTLPIALRRLRACERRVRELLTDDVGEPFRRWAGGAG